MSASASTVSSGSVTGAAARQQATPGLARTLFRLLCCRGRRRPGNITGIVFPIRLGDLVGPCGPELLATLLRCNRHLPANVSVRSVRSANADIKDGVKGDKGVLEVEYDGETDLPRQFFVKFNLQALSSLPMRLLSDASEVCRCEALFYYHLASEACVRTPKCYFTDYSDVTGEFVLLSELVKFDEGGILPYKHRVRDITTLEEQRLFVRKGAMLNAQFWGGDHEALANIPRFDETHERLWSLIQMMAKRSLHHTVRKTMKGRQLADAFITWEPPSELVGREAELIADMPKILRSLCEDKSMVAFGHNDYNTDNAYFSRTDGALDFGAFDWQQSCFNNVGQEWAWNLHFLRPEFLDEHESELIDLLLQTYKEHGIEMPRASFLNAYVLGTVQMYVFGGAGLQMLLQTLKRRGLLETLVPEDPRCGDEALDKGTREKLVGAEMTRRTFTNVCQIMRRHDFAGAWQRWKLARAGQEAEAVSAADDSGMGAAEAAATPQGAAPEDSSALRRRAAR